MGLSSCKGCRASYTGLRCPECGRPLPAVGCATIFVPMILGLSLLAWAIPNETVPRVVEEFLSTKYVFQSFQTAVLWPAGAALLLLLMLLQCVFFRAKKKPSSTEESNADSSGIVRVLCRGGRAVRFVILFLLFGMLALLFLDVILLTPLTQFRQVDVSRKAVVCSGLFFSRELSIADISSARIEGEHVNRKGTDYLDCSIVVESRAAVLRSIEVSLPLSDENLPLFTNMMERCVTDINSRRDANR
jgi:hypothetical protein